MEERDLPARKPDTQKKQDLHYVEKTGGASKSVEKKGPYIMSKSALLHLKLQKHRDTARNALRKKGIGGSVQHPKPSVIRNVKFNKGYAALSQNPEDTLVSIDSDSEAELESQYSSGYSSAEVNQELNRQLLQDGYRLDEIPDDEDLDLIPPKPVSASCACCCIDVPSCTIQ
ncbi:protein FAM219B [Erpetoichthys calabaricus]|uniref:Family with sequence similarity 219 member B n=1 Tax=Erpetoichthys calabaricus TaxID=27687 RepID=A0A8C4TLL7_ERPCA|nr:protein FAM219B [Erpetoichthys calabaricus]